jgi:hypothetical protein
LGWGSFIKNLVSHDLIMETCKIRSFIIHMFHTLISCIEYIFDTQIYRKMRNSYDICSFISSYFIYQTHLSMCQTRFQHMIFMYKWMNKHYFNKWQACWPHIIKLIPLIRQDAWTIHKLKISRTPFSFEILLVKL